MVSIGRPSNTHQMSGKGKKYVNRLPMMVVIICVLVWRMDQMIWKYLVRPANDVTFMSGQKLIATLMDEGLVGKMFHFHQFR